MPDKKMNWPEWGEPATKGDVISALVATKSCVVDIYVCMSAMKRGDTVRFAESLKDLDESDKKLSTLIDLIGGSKSDDGK